MLQCPEDVLKEFKDVKSIEVDPNNRYIIIIQRADARPEVSITGLLVREGSVAVCFKVLTRNPEVPSSSPLPTGHVGANSLLASLPASWSF